MAPGDNIGAFSVEEAAIVAEQAKATGRAEAQAEDTALVEVVEMLVLVEADPRAAVELLRAREKRRAATGSNAAELAHNAPLLSLSSEQRIAEHKRLGDGGYAKRLGADLGRDIRRVAKSIERPSSIPMGRRR